MLQKYAECDTYIVWIEDNSTLIINYLSGDNIMATMLFEQNSEQISKPASQVLMESAGFDYVDCQLCFIFATSEGKRGYG